MKLLVQRAILFACLFAITACNQPEELIPLPSLPDPPKIEAEEALSQADYFVKIDGRRWEDGALESFRLSGFIIKFHEQLYIITAGHVQKPGMKVIGLEVYLKKSSSLSYSATIIAINNEIDLAILQITTKDFTFDGKLASFGDSDLVSKDDPVVSLGHPLGKPPWHASSGKVVSLTYKNGNVALNQIQHSAFGGFGSSGGPLLNASGKVIGMNISMKPRAQGDATSDRINALPAKYIQQFLEKHLSPPR